ncbi:MULTISPECIES: AbrB family transcriptional regulator [Enterococcus]|uniref:AbrB/MazE/SpoVT family DNA-binding domain-containing protein n=1 Tax=Enterococcus TaxID=1350 RepID=UPI0022E174D1|nr:MULTISPECIES: AbrB family transcriptional regulator [Enterococcus]MDO0893853.1 AbrB family transcriptional regulator [Enterococcus sp. B1E4]MDO0906692.1 AbrB family transcriptional regulator [Enterococcus sp. B2E4]
MRSIKVRKIGNSVGIILPKELGLKNGDTLQAEKEGNLFILDTTQTAKNHDKKLIEESFKDFEEGLIVTETEMRESFGKYGWS